MYLISVTGVITIQRDQTRHRRTYGFQHVVELMCQECYDDYLTSKYVDPDPKVCLRCRIGGIPEPKVDSV